MGKPEQNPILLSPHGTRQTVQRWSISPKRSKTRTNTALVSRPATPHPAASNSQTTNLKATLNALTLGPIKLNRPQKPLNMKIARQVALFETSLQRLRTEAGLAEELCPVASIIILLLIIVIIGFVFCYSCYHYYSTGQVPLWCSLLFVRHRVSGKLPHRLFLKARHNNYYYYHYYYYYYYYYFHLLLVIISYLSFTIYYLLFIMYYLFIIYCLLFIIYYLLFIMYYLFIIYCLLFIIY